MHYLAWYTSAHATQAFGVPTCPSQFSDQFLAIASKGDLENATVTALFCQTSYWKQQVTVTVSDDTFHPLNSSLAPDGPAEELPTSEFNSTGFQFLLGSSVSAVQQDSVRDYPDNVIVNMGDRLNGTGVQLPVDPMVAFALSGMERPVEDYLDGSVMAEAYRAVHKSAFVLTYDSLLTTATASNETTEGSVEFIRHGVLVSRVFSGLVEGLLLAVGVCCIILAVLSARVESKLSGNPAALADQMDVLRNSHELLAAAVRERNILKEGKPLDTETTRLHLQCPCESSEAATTITVTGLPPSLEGNDASSDIKDDQYAPVSPIALKRTSGFVFSILLAAAFAGLLALRSQEKKLGGKRSLRFGADLLSAYTLHRSPTANRIIRGPPAPGELHTHRHRNLDRAVLGPGQPATLRIPALQRLTQDEKGVSSQRGHEGEVRLGTTPTYTMERREVRTHHAGNGVCDRAAG